MEYDKDKVDELALALLYLTTFQGEYSTRAWRGMAWEVSGASKFGVFSIQCARRFFPVRHFGQ
jgi:hypothetical protein